MTKYCYSIDQETYVEIGDFESRDEAVQWAIGELDNLDHEHPFEIAIVSPTTPEGVLDWNNVFDGELLLDNAVDLLAQDCAEDACEQFHADGMKHADDLVKRLIAAAKDWQKEHNIAVNFWGVEQVTHHQLPTATEEEYKTCECYTCKDARRVYLTGEGQN